MQHQKNWLMIAYFGGRGELEGLLQRSSKKGFSYPFFDEIPY